MLKSMTAYVHNIYQDAKYKLDVEMRSVNNRYLDMKFNLPTSLTGAENELREIVSRYLRRGKVDIKLQLQKLQAEKETCLNEEVLACKLAEYNTLDRYLLEHLLGYQSNKNSYFRYLVQSNDIFSSTITNDEEQSRIVDFVKNCLEQSVQQFVEVRRREGAKLEADILARIHTLAAKFPEIEEINKETPANELAQLKERLDALLQGSSLENVSDRLYLEIALLADKHDASEEITRLRSHFSEFERLCQQEEAVGKNLDFLWQEMNREVNTMGSKAAANELVKIVVYFKTELEKVREQIQNIE